MKCEKCNNEYPSQYYFATPTICKECFAKLSPDEQRSLLDSLSVLYSSEPYPLRVGFGRRLGAYVIDYLIVGIVTMIAFFMSGVYEEMMLMIKDGGGLSHLQELMELLEPYTMLSILITLAYFSLEIFISASPGKLMLGLKIAGEDQHSASLQTLFIRFAMKHLNTIVSLVSAFTLSIILNMTEGIVSLIMIIGCFFVLSEKRQAFHDMIAKTAVYYKENV
ncbi:MAG: hypothetical protein QG635_682, partial [Bacteroidota bacterium]|nr:hypothetical protein [Bacteroidota bacterium]